MTDLVVIQPFDTYKRGDRITDAAKVSEIEDGEFARFVVRAADVPPPPPVAGPNTKQIVPGAATVAAAGTSAPTVQQTAPEPVIEHGIPEPAPEPTEAAPQPAAGGTVSVTRPDAPTPPSAS